MKKKIIVSMIILSFLIPIGISTKNTLAVGEIENSTGTYFSPEAITTTTFKGTTNITAFVGPDAAYKVIYNSLKNAQTSFYLEVYTLSSEPLVNGLIAAKGRGVEVIVLLSHDRVSGFEDDYTEESASRLDDAGIDVLWTSNTFRFTHAKFWIADSQETFVYSGNWAPSSIPQYEGARKNREMGFLINDATIAAYYEDVFFDDFAISTPYSPISTTGSLQGNETTGTYEHPFDEPYTVVEYAEVTPIFSPDNSYELLSALIKSANTSIDLELQYIKDDCDLVNDLVDAAIRGVSIRIIIPEPEEGSGEEDVVAELITKGVQFRFFSSLGHNHNKYVSVDGEIVQISSINWSNNSITNNRESGAIVKNSNIAAYLKTVFDYDWDLGDIPTGFAEPLSLVSPKSGGIAAGTYDFQVSFAINNYTSGELLIDSTSIHTWTNPDGIESYSYDTTSLSNGIHTITVNGTPDSGPSVQIEAKFNIWNDETGSVLITEIRYDADSEPAGEFVEIYNALGFDVYLEGWILTDNEDEYIIPEDAQINSGEVLIFAQDSSAFISEMSDLGITGVSADYGLGDLSLANSGDEILLKSPDDSTIDAVAWGSGSIASVVSWSGSTGEEQTLQRDPANVDTDNCNDDFSSLAPTPGDVSVDNGSPTDPTDPTDLIDASSVLFVVGFLAVVTVSIRLFTKRK